MSDGVFIIAEAGVNHNGDIKLAYKMIDEAVRARVDAIKFQTFISDNVVSKYAFKAEYQQINTNNNESQLEMVKKLELSFEDFKNLKLYCDWKKILFLSTPFDHNSIDFLDKLGLRIFKIPSGEINNLPYLMKVAKLGKKVIMSTGMATLKEIEVALNILKENGTTDIIVLHCNTEYPTPIEDVNLMAISTLKQTLKTEVGYSDHTLGIEVPIAAVVLGAKVIEKHFTLDKNMPGPDHKASLSPDELKAMVSAIRNIEKALGSGIKEPTPSEKKNIVVARKSIVAKTAIKAGEVYTEDNLDVKRPGNGVSPMMWFKVLGKIAKRDFEEDELIEL